MDKVIVSEHLGYHNSNLSKSIERLEKGKGYRDLSTIIICPTRGMIADRVVQCWMNLMRPMNQKVMGPLFIRGYEVGEAYCMGIDMILSNPDLRDWKYVLTLEEDNMPPIDGLLKLYEGMDQFDVIGGLYWTKGEGGQPMIYGNPKLLPKTYQPQIPVEDSLQECNGLGMGFNLFKLDIFKNPRMERPFFKSVQETTPGVGVKACTQDLYFYDKACKVGYRFACDTRVKVGHYDAERDIVW